MAKTAEIAIVSFDEFINGGDAGRRAVAKELYSAFSTVGWVYLKDFGIPQERVDEIFGLVGAIQYVVYSTSLITSRPNCSSTFLWIQKLPGA